MAKYTVRLYATVEARDEREATEIANAIIDAVDAPGTGVVHVTEIVADDPELEEETAAAEPVWDWNDGPGFGYEPCDDRE